jgi:hypothetical protein
VTVTIPASVPSLRAGTQIFDLPRGATCAICGNQLAGYILRDARGRFLCGSHQPAIRSCRFCDSAFLPGTDGARIDRCGRCAGRSVERFEEASTRFGRLLDWFAQKDMAFSAPLPGITLRDQMPLAADGMPMVGFTEKWAVPRLVIQRGLPAEVFLTVVVHELGHAWLARTGVKLLEPVEEGVCNWLAWHFARKLGTIESNFQAERIEARHDPIYGAGFKRVRAVAGPAQPGDLSAILHRLGARP